MNAMALKFNCVCGRSLEPYETDRCRGCQIKAMEELRRESMLFRDNPNMTLADFEQLYQRNRGDDFRRKYINDWPSEIGVDYAFEKDRTSVAIMQTSPTGRLRNSTIELQNIPMAEMSKAKEQLQREIAAALAVPPGKLGGTGVKKRTDADRLEEFEALMTKSEALLNHFS